jgi:hypothetical protein
MAKTKYKHVKTRFAELPTVESSRQRLAYKPRAYPLKRVESQSIDIPARLCRYQCVLRLEWIAAVSALWKSATALCRVFNALRVVLTRSDVSPPSTI